MARTNIFMSSQNNLERVRESFGGAGQAGEGWYCLQARPKHEHIAAGSLGKIGGVETLCPRMRYRKPTRRGPVWFVEAVFPGYLFARFDFDSQHGQVQSANGIIKIIRFGNYVPRLDAFFIHLLRSRFSQTDHEVIHIEPQFGIGDSVTLASGMFAGLEAVITRVIPAKERILVLLNFLGRQVEAEVSKQEVMMGDSLRLHPFIGNS